MTNHGKRYDEEFKQMLVELYNTSNHTYKSLEREYGVTSATIQRWVKDLTPVDPTNEESMSPKEIAELKKQMAQMQQENEILKKAMAILAKK